MKNNIIIGSLLILIMFIFPLATVCFAPGDAGMAICFILFLIINPLFSIYIGVYSGLNLKSRWLFIIISPVAFLVSSWLLFKIGEVAFLNYALIYFVISLLLSCITAIAKHLINK